MKQVNDEEKNIMLSVMKKKNLALEKEIHYKLFEDDIDRVIYIIKK
jgi:hypothetical protein